IGKQIRPGSTIPAPGRNGQSLDTPPGDTYENSPLVNFVHEKSRDRMRSAIEEMRQRLGAKYPIVINGQKIWADNLIDSINPSRPTQVVGAIVTGNAVIMKPAEQSAVCGAMLMEKFEEAGVPPGVLNFLPGKGRVIGQHLVEHKDVYMIAFTGSREVGLRIWKSAGETREGQLELKRVVCEMGGKNAVIIDSDADLDEAIVDTVYSAFGYQGQKCSACSRLIILEENYERVVERLLAAAESLRIGNPENPGITVGPVIDERAYKRILEMIEAGKKEATLAYQAKDLPEKG